MAAVAGNVSEELNQPSSTVKPALRKCCSVCDKQIYLHQPILFCKNCENVYHGKCLKIKNDLVSTLQQIPWFCTNCNDENYTKCNKNCGAILL